MASYREYEEMHKPPQPGERQNCVAQHVRVFSILFQETLSTCQGPPQGSGMTRESLVSSALPVLVRSGYFLKVIYWIDSIKKEQSDHISLILFEY